MARCGPEGVSRRKSTRRRWTERMNKTEAREKRWQAIGQTVQIIPRDKQITLTSITLTSQSSNHIIPIATSSANPIFGVLVHFKNVISVPPDLISMSPSGPFPLFCLLARPSIALTSTRRTLENPLRAPTSLRTMSHPHPLTRLTQTLNRDPNQIHIKRLRFQKLPAR